jgi:hypothetical protein
MLYHTQGRVDVNVLDSEGSLLVEANMHGTINGISSCAVKERVGLMLLTQLDQGIPRIPSGTDRSTSS